MKERPILFSAPMVRAVLDGRKTQTRRICKDLIGATGVKDVYNRPDGLFIGLHLPRGSGVGITEPFCCPYGWPGDRLWVRETLVQRGMHIGYAADESDWKWSNLLWPSERKSIPSIHMPRYASRITLEIKKVRVELLKAISNDDARAEGIPIDSEAVVWSYRQTWEAINGPNSWEQNPWVWVVEFERIKP